VKPAGSESDYLRAPIGRYVTGRNWISYCPDERLAGVVIWGRPEDEDIRQLLRTTPLEGPSPLVASKARLVDARQLDVPPPSVFAELHGYFQAHREVAPAAVTRLALLRPPGMVGALVIGFAQLLGMKFPIEPFTDPEEALAWLAVPEHAGVLDEVERLKDEMAGGVDEVRALRATLEAGGLSSATLGTIARKMGLSTRSLQRRLRTAGTSFQRELATARVRVAQRMLAESSASVSEVAWEVGYSSMHQFALAFRKVTGASPRQWRSDQRKG
jgi:AraC-like DNA-binding protein